ncbi:MAG: hypothetical protein HZB51_04730 [Chloroflexi bacterium]|nr:hypothetical protein [Chloroflexota bacterium]
MTKLIVLWNFDSPYLLWFGLAAMLMIFVMARQHRSLLIFALLWGLLNILPVVGFQRIVDPRFLYASSVSPAVWLAAFSEQALRFLNRWRIAPFLVLFVLSWIFIGNGMGVALAAGD